MTGPHRPALLVGIDTEGDNQWDEASRRHPTFENIYALERLHDFFARHGARPTYLTTYPVAADTRSADVLGRLQARGDCEIGAHHHAWETPPCGADDAARHQYALSLPMRQFDDQLASLTEAIAGAVGRRPVSYRSGRFGFSAAHVSSLERSGYKVDSSIAPLFFEAHKGGPDFVGAPLTPYFLSYDDARVPGTSGVLELPVSAAINRRLPGWLERAYGRAPRPYTTKRLLRLTRIATVRWLRPSYSSAGDMMALADQLVRRNVPILNLLFHSSEAIVGGSPYNRTASELASFFDRLGQVLEHAVAKLGAEPMTLAEFHDRYVSRAYSAHARSTA